jgi:hypothetical protein
VVWARTLGNLVTDVQDRADVAGYIARHPPATLRRRVIESYHAMREMLLSWGSTRWSGLPFTLDPTLAVPLDSTGVIYSLSYTNGPENPIERPRLLEAQIVPGKWEELVPISLGDIAEYTVSNISRPRAWVLTGSSGDPVLDETSLGGMMKVLIVPSFPTTIVIRAWATSVINITDADATNLTLDGPGFDWIIWDAVIKIAARDNDSQNTYQIAQIERDKSEALLRAGVKNERRTSVQRRDIMGRSDRFSRRFR